MESLSSISTCVDGHDTHVSYPFLAMFAVHGFKKSLYKRQPEKQSVIPLKFQHNIWKSQSITTQTYRKKQKKKECTLHRYGTNLFSPALRVLFTPRVQACPREKQHSRQPCAQHTEAKYQYNWRPQSQKPITNNTATEHSHICTHKIDQEHSELSHTQTPWSSS